MRLTEIWGVHFTLGFGVLLCFWVFIGWFLIVDNFNDFMFL